MGFFPYQISHILINSPIGFLFDKLSISNTSVMLSEPSLCLWLKTSELGAILTKKENHQKAKQALRFINSRIQSLLCATASFWELIRRAVGIAHPVDLFWSQTSQGTVSHSRGMTYSNFLYLQNVSFDYIKILLSWRVQWTSDSRFVYVTALFSSLCQNGKSLSSTDFYYLLFCWWKCWISSYWTPTD